jgi:hypothetical protein
MDMRPVNLLMLLALALTAVEGRARADAKTCIDAAEQGQNLRGTNKLVAAKLAFAGCAADTCPAAIRKDCAQWVLEVESAIPSLVFGAKIDGADATAVRVFIDGALAAQSLDGRAVPIDPGPHVVRFETSGLPPLERSVVVNEGAKGRGVDVEWRTSLKTNPVLVGATSNTTAGSTSPASGPNDTGESRSDVEEKKGQSYYFIGAHYRGNVLPKFMVNLLVDETTTFYFNNVGIEFEIRRDNFSLIPGLSFVDYDFSPVLSLEKGKDPNNAANWSSVSSTLKAIYGTLDVLWSKNLDSNRMWAFEYGLGFGVGFIFGHLSNNWVYQAPNGSLASSGGARYSECVSETAGTGCSKADHVNADVAKVNGFQEPSWFSGGSVPNIFPHLALPQIGIRFKPVKNFQMRLTAAFTLTGFMFGISGYYGTELSPKGSSSSPSREVTN